MSVSLRCNPEIECFSDTSANARSESLADARIVRGMKSPSPLIEEGGSDEELCGKS